MIDAIREKVNERVALTTAEATYLWSNYPVMREGDQIGMLAPKGAVGGFCIQTFDETDFTGVTFKVKAE